MKALLERLARHAPERVAVEDVDGQALTFGGLLAAIEARAHELGAVGLGPGARLALVRERSSAWIVDLLATWRLGASAVLLDPAAPPLRLADMLARARPRLVSRDAAMEVCAESASADPREAYLVFTSGSSGHPKGVCLPADGLVPLWRAQSGLFELGPGARALAVLSMGFDASLSDLGTALWSGATLVLAARDAVSTPERLVETLALRGITHVDLPPSWLPSIAPDAWPASLATLIVGGEAAVPEVLAAHAAARRIINVYGPTECTVCVTAQLVRPRVAPPSLGAALPGVRLRIEDVDGREAQEGELLIASAGLLLGYLDDPSATQAAVVERDGVRYFRSGDRVRGPGLEFLGRRDRQLKRAGVRLELDEIEHAIGRVPGVRAVAVGLVDGAIRAALEGEVAPEVVREALTRWLPSVAVPRTIEVSSMLPRTLNGKVDRRAALATPVAGAVDQPLPTEPSALRLALAARVLGLAAVDPAQSFLAAGGDSYAALRLSSELAARGHGSDLAGLLDGAALGVWAAAASDDTWVQLGPAAVPRARTRRASTTRTRVLLTGATGFLGGWVLRRLLARPDVEVTALVRAGSLPAARARLGTLDPRVTVAVGAIDRATLEAIAGPFSHVLHAAGRVSQGARLEALVEANVTTTGVLVELARREGARFVLAGSLAPLLLGETVSTCVREADLGPDRGCVAGAYAASKALAERVVLGSGIEVTVARLGLLIAARADGEAHARCQLTQLLQAVLHLGVAPELSPEARVDATPVDCAAEALVRLALMEGAPPIAHVSTERGHPWSALVAGWPAVAPEACWRRASSALDDTSTPSAARGPLSLLLGALRHRGLGEASASARELDLCLLTGTRIDRGEAERALGRGVLPDADPADLVRAWAYARGRAR